MYCESFFAVKAWGPSSINGESLADVLNRGIDYN